jgi:spore coat polysaccharide biosynthesis protein SpsF
MSSKDEEGQRLEALWQGKFGDDYTARSPAGTDGRLPFWKDLISGIEVERTLEVGCNLGANVRWLATLLPPHQVFGIDVNNTALAKLRSELPTVNAVWSPARSLPFRDRYFDLVYTIGVLIHQPQETLLDVMSEIVRCSKRYVLAGEYYAEQLTEVPYHGNKGALFKLDFGGLYLKTFPELKLVNKGFLPRSDHADWDDITWWLMEKR